MMFHSCCSTIYKVREQRIHVIVSSAASTNVSFYFLGCILITSTYVMRSVDFQALMHLLFLRVHNRATSLELIGNKIMGIDHNTHPPPSPSPPLFPLLESHLSLNGSNTIYIYNIYDQLT